MGRTNPTYRVTLRGIEDRWQPFRRALRQPDQPSYDRLFEHARAHAAAASYLNHEEPLFPLLVSIVLEQEKRISQLEERVETPVGDRVRSRE